MSGSDSYFYWIVALIAFLVSLWIDDKELSGFAIGVATMVGIFNHKKWSAAAEEWQRRKFFADES